MNAGERPIVAITIGDPAGIGPETVGKALADEEIYRQCRPLVIGEAGIMRSAIRLAGRPLQLHAVTSTSDTQGRYGAIDLLDLHNITPREVIVGKICKACGHASMQFIEKAAELAMRQEVSAIVTAPINKEATQLAGYGDIGHLEYLARVTGKREYATMLVSGELRAVHLTTHYSLREACDKVTRERVLARLKLTDACFREWGFARPRIAVAALNPHGGEGGLFGREEIEQIAPAVQDAAGLGIAARGPFPADSIFNRALGGEFDVVLVMYHDQGHIAVKVHGFEESVSVALGLPFIRTSVDHGTAFDIAGKGIASSRSMEEAIKMAVNLVRKKRLVR